MEIIHFALRHMAEALEAQKQRAGISGRVREASGERIRYEFSYQR